MKLPVTIRITPIQAITLQRVLQKVTVAEAVDLDDGEFLMNLFRTLTKVNHLNVRMHKGEDVNVVQTKILARTIGDFSIDARFLEPLEQS